MGYGPSPEPKLTWRQRMFPEHGTYAEYKKQLKAQAERDKEASREGEGLMTIPRGKHPKLDAFDDLLENGARIANEQRRWLVGIPTSFAMACGTFLVLIAWSIFKKGLQGMAAATVMQEYTTRVQACIVFLCWAFILMLASLSPTNVKGIYYTAVGLIVYFAGCGTIVCPIGMPYVLPDKTGTVFTLWMVCGMIKCIGVIITLVWATLTQPPRKCLRIMEWSMMIVIVGIGIFMMLAACATPNPTPPRPAPPYPTPPHLNPPRRRCIGFERAE